MKISGIYFVTDRSLSRVPVPETVLSAIEGGAELVQYREKELCDAEAFHELEEISEVCAQSSVPLLVNNRIDWALAVNALGVHVGQDDLPVETVRQIFSGEVGVTVHTVEEAVVAEKCGVHHVSVSPIFQTATKQDAGNASGVELISEVKDAVSLPVVAIGGINSENISEVANAGADAVAIVSEILESDDIAGKVAELRGIFYDNTA